MMKKILFFLVILFISLLWGNNTFATNEENYQLPRQGFFLSSPNKKYLCKVLPTSNGTKVQVFALGQTKPIAEWTIPSQSIHTAQFSPRHKQQLLIATPNQIYLYHFGDSKKVISWDHPQPKGKKITHATFDRKSGNILWTTNNTAHISSISNQSSSQFAQLEEEQKIQSIASLRDDNVAIAQDQSKEISIFSTQKKFTEQKPIDLKGHHSNLVALESPKGIMLYSLDANKQLLVWNTKQKRLLSRTQLKVSPKKTVIGFSIDDQKKDVLVVSKDQDGVTGKRYSISQTEQNISSKTKSEKLFATPSKKVYSSYQSKEDKELEKAIEQRLNRLLKKKTILQKKSSFYDLAKIETENGNFDKALEYIEKVPTNPIKEYGLSRALKKEIRKKVQVQGNIDAAVEQYQNGYMQAAQILLEKALFIDPDNTDAKKYSSLIEGKLNKDFLLKIFLLLGVIVLSGVLLKMLLPYRFEIIALKTKRKHKNNSSSRNTTSKHQATKPKEEKKKPEKNIEQDDFLKILSKTKDMLQTAMAKDAHKQFYQNWIDLEAKINLVARKSQRNPDSYSELKSQLKKNQAEIQGYVKKLDEKTKEEKKTKPEEFKDFYQVLDITRRATLDEVKQAYRKKVHQYHPDKHSSSGYDWVKEEAVRMTRLIQEAYDTLKDVQKRMEYNQKIRMYEEK